MHNNYTILLAEDEPALGQIVKDNLESKNFKVYWCENGEIALETYHTTAPDILILDVMMPKKDGFTLAKEIREIDKNTPILFLTSKSQAHDVVEGFTIGGNDYLKKPFSIEELMVRVLNLLKQKPQIENEDLLNLGQYTFHYSKQNLIYKKNPPEQLTHREAQLLFYLIKNKNELLDRSIILNKLWGNDDFFSARSMDVFITKLRKKLSKDPNIQIINVRGYGYKLIC